MTIKTSIPSSRLRPGNTQEFNYKQASKGLTPTQKLVGLIGCKLASGPATAEKPYTIFSEKDGDDLFGAGSELAIMIRAAFAAANKIRSQPQIIACGVLEPAGGTVATKTITITGTATASGDLEVRICGRTIRCTVTTGDVQNTIAAALKAAIDAYQAVEPLVVTAGVATNVVTLSCRHKGVNGNDVKVDWTSGPLGVSVAIAAGVTATGVYDITLSLDAINPGKTCHGIAIANHLAADVSDFKVHLANVGDPAVKKWTSCFLAEVGSVATTTTLGTGSNDYGVQLLAYRNSKLLPGELAAQACLANWAIDDPAANFDGFELPIFPVDTTDAYTNPEVEVLLAAGCTPLVPTDSGTTSKIVRSVTTKTTEAGVPFLALLDLSTVKSMYYVATQLDIKLTLAFQGLDAKMTPDIGPQVEDVGYDTLKQIESLKIVKNVDANRSQIRCETDAVVPTRANFAYPLAPILNMHQLASVGNLIVG
jgi:phage tail sheath gpL-like